MANLIINPGFEGATGAPWELTGHAEIQSERVRTGNKALRLRSVFVGTLGQHQRSIVEQDIVTDGAIETLKLWIYPNDALTGPSTVGRLRITWNNVVLLNLERPDLSSGWNLVELTPEDPTSPATLRISTRPTGTGTGISDWYIDDVSYGEEAVVGDEPDVVTNNIRAALLADLAAINGAAPFVSTVSEVNAEPKPLEMVTTPAVSLIPFEGGSSDPDQLTNRSGLTEQLFTVQMVVRSDTPHQTLADLLDDVRNAVERSSSNVSAVDGVYQADVVNWTPPLTSEDITNQYGVQEADVRVIYTYIRGAA